MKEKPSDAVGAGSMTREAQESLRKAGFSRRAFLKGSGALIVTFSVSGVGAAQPAGPRRSRIPAPDRVDSWIAVGDDGRVTAYAGKCELGHGLHTAQTQLIAEELVVPLDVVRLVSCDTAITPDQGTTSGSQSHPENFNHANLAQAAATAREALLGLASERLKVQPELLTIQDGVIAVITAPDRRVSYGELVGGRRFDIPVDEGARRRPKHEWTVLGTPVPRLEIPEMVAGTYEYVHNVRVPGMLHGQVVRPPAAIGARLVSVNEASLRGLPGIVKVVVRRNFVGVVAEKPWQAFRAARQLKVQWTPGASLPGHADFYDHVRKQRQRRDSYVVNSRDVDAAFDRAAQVVRASYYHPYQAHGSVGTSCAVADVREDRATIWSATQACYPLRDTTAVTLGLSPERVRVIFTLGSGCYGLNGADAVSYDAAVLSQAVGRPVRVQLTRRDEMAWDNYGTAAVVDERVALDAAGNIMAWDYEGWFPTLGGRPGYERPGNVITGLLLGFEPESLGLPEEVAQAQTPGVPQEPTGPFRNRRNEAPNYVAGCIGGTCGGTGTVKSERVLSHSVPSLFFTGPLRSPWRLQNTFAHECFMDEVAARAQADPVAYRLRHLADPRLRDVLNVAAKTAGWKPRPSPRPDRPQTGISEGRGIACVLYEGDNGYSAMVADVEVNQGTGLVAVKRLVVSIDCGPISNPDGLRNQTEGGALHGACRALQEEVTWDETRVTSVDWRRYPTWSLGSQVPSVECVLIDRADVEASGAGETSITVAAAAIGNAIFDATGARVRQVPFTAERVLAALQARC